MKADEFTCEVCHGTFPKAWTDEEAAAEREQIFGAPVADDDGLVCEDCWQKMGSFFGWVDERVYDERGIELEPFDREGQPEFNGAFR